MTPEQLVEVIRSAPCIKSDADPTAGNPAKWDCNDDVHDNPIWYKHPECIADLFEEVGEPDHDGWYVGMLPGRGAGPAWVLKAKS